MEGVGVATAKVAKARDARLAFMLDMFEALDFESWYLEGNNNTDRRHRHRWPVPSALFNYIPKLQCLPHRKVESEKSSNKNPAQYMCFFIVSTSGAAKALELMKQSDKSGHGRFVVGGKYTGSIKKDTQTPDFRYIGWLGSDAEGAWRRTVGAGPPLSALGRKRRLWI